MYLGVPVILGRNGIEKVIEFNLTDDEKAIYNAYAEWYKVNYSESEEDDSDKVNKSQEEADKDSKEDEEATKA